MLQSRLEITNETIIKILNYYLQVYIIIRLNITPHYVRFAFHGVFGIIFMRNANQHKIIRDYFLYFLISPTYHIGSKTPRNSFIKNHTIHEIIRNVKSLYAKRTQYETTLYVFALTYIYF